MRRAGRAMQVASARQRSCHVAPTNSSPTHLRTADALSALPQLSTTMLLRLKRNNLPLPPPTGHPCGSSPPEEHVHVKTSRDPPCYIYARHPPAAASIPRAFHKTDNRIDELSHGACYGQCELQGCQGQRPPVQENRGAYVCGIDDLKLESYKLPESLGPEQARVRIKAVGICGSDVHYLKHLKVGAYEVKEPMVIGHESAGVVEEVGSEVKHLAPGDRVALEPGVPCWKCSFCREGLYNLCPDMAFFATPPVHGSLADQVVHPAELCFKLPEGVSLEEGAMCEPLSVGVHACRRTHVGPDTRVLIIGGGAIGLVTMLVARAFGSPRIVVADTHNERLATAKRLGADETVLVSKNPEDMGAEIEEIRKKMGGAIEVSCDCVGSTKSLTTCLEITRSAGRVCVVGMRETDMTLPISAAMSREVDILGVFRYRNTYPLCLDLIASGRVDVKPLITHRYKFSEQEIKDAFEMSAHGGNAIKVMFNL